MVPVKKRAKVSFSNFQQGYALLCAHDERNETFIVQRDQLILGSFMLISCCKPLALYVGYFLHKNVYAHVGNPLVLFQPK